MFGLVVGALADSVRAEECEVPSEPSERVAGPVSRLRACDIFNIVHIVHIVQYRYLTAAERVPRESDAAVAGGGRRRLELEEMDFAASHVLVHSR